MTSNLVCVVCFCLQWISWRHWFWKLYANMAAQGINQKEYLKKYLSASSDDKKKKKKRNKGKPIDERFRIIDDDIDLKNMRPLEDNELELYSLAEDAPQIAGIVDERPDELRTLEEFGTKRWKVVADENGIDDIKVTAIGHIFKPNTTDNDRRLNNEEEEQRQSPVMKHDSDASPVRKSRVHSSPDASPSRKQRSNISPKSKNDSKTFNYTKVQKETDSRLQSQDVRQRDLDVSPPRRVKKELDDSDESPPRKLKKNESLPRQLEKQTNLIMSPPRRPRKSDSDKSSPRKSKRNDDSDESPPRRSKKPDTGKSPPQKVKRNYDSDESPPRRAKKPDPDKSPPRKPKRGDSDESPPRQSKRPNLHKSPPRKPKRNDDSDESPARRSKKANNSHESPPRKSKRKDFSDESPPRKSKRKDDSDESPPRKVKRREDSDESPPRKSRRNEVETQSMNTVKHSKSQNSSNSVSKAFYHGETSKKLQDHHSRSSPVRKSRFTDIDDSISKDINKRGSSRESDSDISPLRKSRRNEVSKRSPVPSHRRDESSSRTNRKEFSAPSRKSHNQSDSDESPPCKARRRDDSEAKDRKHLTSKELTERTLDGRKAGLQDAKELRKEIADMQRKEHEIFEKMDPSLSGKGAAPVMRDRKTGKRRDLDQEAKEKTELDKKQAEHKTKYTRWGKGLKQVEDQAQKLKDDLYEMTKPLARYADDVDLDKHLRDQDREGDPMLEYIRSKATDCSIKNKPKYEGSFLPNRFGIRPGHRWDGVDRSSGYEKQYFETLNSKQAAEEEAYKWSTSDM